MAAKLPRVSRVMVGICAGLCLALALWRFFVAADRSTDPLLGAAWRVAIVMGALWWALPVRGESWVWRRVGLVAVVVLAVVALRGRALLVVMPLILAAASAAWLVRPRR